MIQQGTVSKVEASRRIGISEATLRRWVSEGAVETVMVEGYKNPRVPLSEIERVKGAFHARMLPGPTDGRCRDCLKKKPIKKYGRCLACSREKVRKGATKRDNRKFLDWQLRKSFGITIEQYERMFEDQSGLCAICGEPESETRNGRVKRLCVDHDHSTGVVRGLLCGSCNRLLHAVEKRGWIKKAKRYLKDGSLGLR